VTVYRVAAHGAAAMNGMTAMATVSAAAMTATMGERGRSRGQDQANHHDDAFDRHPVNLVPQPDNCLDK
jgi:hypothetical protein